MRTSRLGRARARALLAPALIAPSLTASFAAAQRVDNAQHHAYVTTDFRTESGVVLPKVTIVYGTYGHLNAARDNAVLLPSHYMATHHGYE